MQTSRPVIFFGVIGLLVALASAIAFDSNRWPSDLVHHSQLSDMYYKLSRISQAVGAQKIALQFVINAGQSEKDFEKKAIAAGELSLLTFPADRMSPGSFGRITRGYLCQEKTRLLYMKFSNNGPVEVCIESSGAGRLKTFMERLQKRVPSGYKPPEYE